MNNSSFINKFTAHVVLVAGYVILIGGCSSQNSNISGTTLTVSKSHRICSRAAHAKLESFESALDFEWGKISTPNGSSIDFSVGQILDDTNVLSASSMPELSLNGIKATKELRSDQTESITLSGFSKGSGGTRKVSVRYQFSAGNQSSEQLAAELANSTVSCDQLAKETR